MLLKPRWMHFSRSREAVLILLALLTGAAWAASDDGCMDFKWDVSKERRLFAGAPAAVTAGKNARSAPTVVPNRLYQLRLVIRDEVTFAATPRNPLGAAMYAGLATLKISAPGSYRIAVDLPFWIDVVWNGSLLTAKDFQGQYGCKAPHKIVEFDLPGAQPFTLQFSNATKDSALFTVTASPARKL